MEKKEGVRLTWADANVWTSRVEDGPYQLGFLLAPEGNEWRLSVFESNAGSREPRQLSVLVGKLREGQELAQRLVDRWLVDWSWQELQRQARDGSLAGGAFGAEPAAAGGPSQ